MLRKKYGEIVSLYKTLPRYVRDPPPHQNLIAPPTLHPALLVIAIQNLLDAVLAPEVERVERLPGLRRCPVPTARLAQAEARGAAVGGGGVDGGGGRRKHHFEDLVHRRVRALEGAAFGVGHDFALGVDDEDLALRHTDGLIASMCVCVCV